MTSTNQYGIDELAAPGTGSPTVDIVFVHGLMGHREHTWTKDDVFWPQALLPALVPTARILTFGYEAQVVDLNKELAQGTMETHAADLCDRLAGIRTDGSASRRPIVFVAHSLGGLISAQAIIKGAVGVETDNVRIIADCCTGMIFLGTHFYGSAPAKYLDVIRAIVGTFVKTNKQKIQDLKEKSERLGLLVERFGSRLHQRLSEGDGIELQFFFETLPTLGVMVVPESNARIMGFESYASIQGANHTEMTKFEREDDEGYKSVSSSILKLSKIKRAPKSTGSVNNTWNNNDNSKVGQQGNTLFDYVLCLYRKINKNNFVFTAFRLIRDCREN